MRNGKYVFCQFGAGRIGHIHAGNIFQSERAELKYIIDPFPEAAEKLAEKNGATVVNAETAFADDEVDAVLICSPTDTHADLIEQSARAGKAVFTEKPIDLDLDRVNSVKEIVENEKTLLLVGFNRRFDPTLGGLGKSLHQGNIGKVETVIITSRDPSPPPISYIKSSGGLFLDMMIHDLDLAYWLLGEVPNEVFARGTAHVDPEIANAGDIDTAVVTLATKTGKLCHISNSRRAVYGYDQRIEVLGSDGMLKAENMIDNHIQLWNEDGIKQAKPVNFFLERYANAYRNELHHFLDCLDGKDTPLTGMDEGRIALILALACKQSLESNQPVKIDI